MLRPHLGSCCSTATPRGGGGGVACHAAGRRGGGGGGGRSKGGSSSSSNSSSSSGATSAAKLAAAAKAAAKRATAFARQRQERAYELAAAAQQQALPINPAGAAAPPSSSGVRASSPTSSSSSTRLKRPGQGQSRSSSRDGGSGGADSFEEEAGELQPYVNVITAHLKQQQQGGSSSSGGGRGRGAKRGAVQSLMEAHTAAFQAALDLELQMEWQEAEERLQAWPQQRLAAEGVALFGLAAAPDGGGAAGAGLRDVVLRFFRPGQPLPFHCFSQGDILLVSQGDPLADSHEAVVVDCSSRWIRLALSPTAAAAVAAAAGRSWRRGSTPASGSVRTAPQQQQQQQQQQQRGIWRLDLFANTVSHERCSEGLQRFAAAVTQGQGQQGLLSQAVSGQQELLCRLLAGVLPAGTPLPAAAGHTPPWAKSQRAREALSGARAYVKTLVQDGSLNPSQGSAIEAALAKTLTLWQGPPGTGKTTTLLRFCEASLRVLGPDQQLLAVAASNVAVDQLASGLLGLGLRVVRLGQPVKVTPALRSVTLEVLAAATAPGQAAAKLRQQLVAAAAASRGSSGSSSRNMGRRGTNNSSSSGGGKRGGSGGGQPQGGLWEQVVALEAAAAAEVLGGAQVVAATCVGAGDPLLSDRSFAVAVLDEATQAPEPAALTALAQRAQSLVMVGDPRQLPPTVRCPAAEALGLGTSLFERLQAMGAQPWLLDTQFRMHPALAAFPSEAFYEGRLKSAPRPRDRPLPRGLAWPNPKVPVLFLQVSGSERRTAASSGWAAGRAREQGGLATSTDDESSTSSTRGDKPAVGGKLERSSSSSNGGNNGSSSSSSSGGHSYFNAAEADVVVGVLQQLVEAGLAPEDVCVITPYSGQVRMIQRLLPAELSGSGSASSTRPQRGSRQRDAAGGSNGSRLDGSLQQQQQPSAAAAPPAPMSPALGVEVRSVDGFQGREKEVVVFSAVRCNPRGRVGFLADARRLNVALTRARRGLVVVGDAATLGHDPVWRNWLDWARREGVVAAVAGGSDQGRRQQAEVAVAAEAR